MRIKNIARTLTLLCCLLGVAAGTNQTSLRLVWDPPSDGYSTNSSYQVYHSTNITTPLTNWALLTNLIATSSTVKVQVIPGPHLFAITHSNIWGVSDFSPVAATPALPRSDVSIQISREE